MMKFALLASGSKGNSFLIQDEGTNILIDCGSTKKHLLTSLQHFQLNIEDLDALVITHDHSDHVSQIRHFRDIDIYSPVEIDDIDVFLVRPLQKFTINNLTFTPIPLSHDALHTTGYVVFSGFEKLVYITDTGYVNQRYIPLLYGADWIILESNHDVEMLMHTARPQYLKQRICSDEGHLNNEDCAEILNEIVTENTKMVILAHLSQQANTRERALTVSRAVLKEKHLRHELILCAAGQFEMIEKGGDDEKINPGTVWCTVGLEYGADGKTG